MGTRIDISAGDTLPCGSACELVWWMAVEESDIRVLSARRCTLRLAADEEDFAPITVGGVPIRLGPRHDGVHPGSCIDLDTNDLPAEITRQLLQRLMRHPGEPVSVDRCEWPCECWPNRPAELEAAGQGEAKLNLWIEYDVEIQQASSRIGNRRMNEPPPLAEMEWHAVPPEPFVPETDLLEFRGLMGPHRTWQLWRVMRRYRAVLNVDLRYQATRLAGTCKEVVGPV